MSTQAIILVDHGSKQPGAGQLLARIADSVAAQTGTAAYIAHLSAAPPTLATAMERAVAAGTRRVVVCPYFLGEGRHSRSDVPEQAARAAADHPQVEVVVTEPLGARPELADVVAALVRPYLREGAGT